MTLHKCYSRVISTFRKSSNVRDCGSLTWDISHGGIRRNKWVISSHMSIDNLERYGLCSANVVVTGWGRPRGEGRKVRRTGERGRRGVLSLAQLPYLGYRGSRARRPGPFWRNAVGSACSIRAPSHTCPVHGLTINTRTNILDSFRQLDEICRLAKCYFLTELE